MEHTGKNKNENLKHVFKNTGIKATTQRVSILEGVLKINNHFDADDLVRSMREKNIRISRATVYRALAHLEKHNVISKLGVLQGRSYFENRTHKNRHDHICCVRCGKIIEFNDSIIEERINKVSGFNGFSIKSISFQIFGICAKCRRKMELQPDAGSMN